MTRRVAFPPLGFLSRVAEAYLHALGVETVTPPPTSRRTLDIGVQGSPEMICIPCKLLFGNYVEAAERGATDIVMLGGPGTCRLGYSVAQQARRLQEWGFAVRVHTLDLYHVHRDIFRLTRAFADGRPATELVEPIRFLLALLDLTDALETGVLVARPRERERGAADRAYAAAWERIAALRTREELEEQRDDILGLLDAVDLDEDRPVLRIGLVGDVYTILTPFLNHNLEVQLGRMGVEVRRWFRYTGRVSLPLPDFLRMDRGGRARRAGSRYLKRDVGGFARSTVAEAALMAEGEVDGLIHVAPFNCTPETVAQSALVALQRERGVPVLSLSFDEQTGAAGVMTRLEAFVDMLWSARRRQR
jgi:predicted nucleotide-binding protein (sugar kinase/HSP70/actin superfamily)